LSSVEFGALMMIIPLVVWRCSYQTFCVQVRLVARSVKLPTTGNRAFPVAAAKIYCSLLHDSIVSALSVESFRGHLKTAFLHILLSLSL